MHCGKVSHCCTTGMCVTVSVWKCGCRCQCSDASWHCVTCHTASHWIMGSLWICNIFVVIVMIATFHHAALAVDIIDPQYPAQPSQPSPAQPSPTLPPSADPGQGTKPQQWNAMNCDWCCLVLWSGDGHRYLQYLIYFINPNFSIYMKAERPVDEICYLYLPWFMLLQNRCILPLPGAGSRAVE